MGRLHHLARGRWRAFRLRASLGANPQGRLGVSYPIPDDAGEVLRQLLQLVEANQAHNATLRLAIVRNGPGMWADPAVGRPSDLIALTADSKEWGDSVKLAYVRDARHAACPFAGPRFSPGP